LRDKVKIFQESLKPLRRLK